MALKRLNTPGLSLWGRERVCVDCVWSERGEDSPLRNTGQTSAPPPKRSAPR